MPNPDETMERIPIRIPEVLNEKLRELCKKYGFNSTSQMATYFLWERIKGEQGPNQPPVQEAGSKQNDLLERRVEDIVAKKVEELLIKREGDIFFNQRKYQKAVNAYLETIEMDNKEKVLPDLENAEVLMKLAYSYVNVQDFNTAKVFLQEAKRIYTRMKKEAEVKIIDSTIDKLNSSISAKE